MNGGINDNDVNSHDLRFLLAQGDLCKDVNNKILVHCRDKLNLHLLSWTVATAMNATESVQTIPHWSHTRGRFAPFTRDSKCG